MHNSEYKQLIMSSRNQSEIYNHTRDYLATHCINPQSLKIYDSYLNKFRDIRVDCGHCAHCRSRKTNEWVTRMYYHLEDYKYVYFVTLTYNSIYRLTPTTRYYIDYFRDAFWHYDNINTTHRYCWRPCVLVKKHYQDFIKRLRKYANLNDLTYFACGEHGHSFGAPHFHFILFSNSVITHDNIKRAWSCKIYKDASGRVCRATNHAKRNVHTLSFGRTDFHDLVANGSLNTAPNPSATLLDKKFSAKNCFAYVCKYLNKKECTNIRLQLVFDALKVVKRTVEVFERPSTSGMSTILTPTREVLCVHNTDPYLYTNNIKLYYSYDNSTCFFGNYKLPVYDTTNCDAEEYQRLRNFMFHAFKQEFAPFTTMSRGTPIGSLYFASHVDQLLEDKLDAPSLLSEGFIAPRYFQRKLDEYIYGFRSRSTKSRSTTFTKQNVSAYYEDFLALRDGIVPKHLRVVPEGLNEAFDLFHSSFCYKDSSTGERILFYFRSSPTLPCAIVPYHYKYNRSTHTFDFVRTSNIQEFCAIWLKRLQASFDRHIKQIELAEEQRMQLCAALGHIENFMQENNAYKWLFSQCYQDLEKFAEYHQREYYEQRFNLE